jgi:hypothetical protein
MLHFTESESPFKSLPGLVSANPDGLVIHAQDVRWFDDIYEIGGASGGGPYRDGGGSIFVPITYPGEPTRFRVVLTRNGLVLDDSGNVPGEVCYLAALTLRSGVDTCETVDVEVPRRTCTTETPADARRHAVPALLVTPAANPERSARVVRAAALAPLRSKRVAAMTPAERNTLLEAVAQKLGLIDEGAP